MIVDAVLIGIGFFCLTTYKEVVQAPTLPYASVVFGTYTQAPPLSGATVGIFIASCCRTTFKDVGRRTHKEVAQASRLPYASVVFGTREHRSRKTLFQRHFLHHKFHTSCLGLNTGPVVQEVTDLLNQSTSSL
jgi:hypothetical protein